MEQISISGSAGLFSMTRKKIMFVTARQNKRKQEKEKEKEREEKERKKCYSFFLRRSHPSPCTSHHRPQYQYRAYTQHPEPERHSRHP
ncbi:hypothetical protein P167DRAFT_372524 [Morchella conica CCBAS932]|uniref:Uncharacterized protein n=1 Tax=Morchella conica CCBAS932 TaxID=1392247 RepID=A0A3N4KES4_9PEZI|nr:hypothetical protein P167DRAFT_372524 [Morchella conica CCBAS932]